MKAAKFPRYALSVAALLLLGACVQNPTVVSAPDGLRRVGNATWVKHVSQQESVIVDAAVPAGMARLVFIRPNSAASQETSVNIGVNDRFLDSLQAGNFSTTLVCAGTVQLSVVTTGLKTNNLLANDKTYALEAGHNYFFMVDAQQVGYAQLQPMDPAQGAAQLQGKRLQDHQVSRVVPHCVSSAPERRDVLTQLAVYFENNKADIQSNYYAEIQRVAAFMQQYPNSVISIEGHTDNRADAVYNQKLSQKRAEAVRQVLIQHFGIAANRLRAVGYGESQPIASNDTEAGRQKNRRVLAVIEAR